MITEIESERMVVISDLHLGNPFCQGKRRIVKFLSWAIKNNFDICINGDGLEIAQASFRKLAMDVPDVFHSVRSASKRNQSMYYVVGNHDIALENFLADWGTFAVTPFLNVWSGNSRIRIEHGHLYDPFFVKNPDRYEFMTWLAGLLLKIHPSLYKMWIAYENFKSCIRLARNPQILGEHANFSEAANELANRGFDYVVFGHTHHVGEIELAEGQKYFNSGSWMWDTHYVEIVNGQVSLKRWAG